MNIILIPHNFTRHVAVAFYTGAVPLLIWWLVVTWRVALGSVLFENGLLYIQAAEGPILFTLMAGGIAAVHMSAEGGLRRRALAWKILLPFLAWFFASLFTVLLVVAVELLTPLIVGLISPALGEVVGDPATATLRFRILEWVLAGGVVGVVTIVLRAAWGFVGYAAPYIPDSLSTFLELPADPPKVRVSMIIDHLLAGVGSALVGAAIWQLLGHIIIKDLYLASAVGFTTWGFLFGLLAWGVPSDLYAGWIRVLSSHRYGHRIPIDAPEGGVVERAMGHYPRGLDLWVSADHGVAELHASFVADGDGNYYVRGLSQQPIKLKRPLEAFDLDYEPSSPVPIETDLRMEDRILVGPKGQRTEVEFILLPKEER